VPAKFIFRVILIVFVLLLALILNAEGKLLANETPLLMVLVVRFMAGGTALNFVQIQRWRQQQVNSQASLEVSNSMIVEDTQRLTRYYRRWLLAMPVFYLVALFGKGQNAAVDAHSCHRLCALCLQLCLVLLQENQASLST